jgi:hypothetical protein
VSEVDAEDALLEGLSRRLGERVGGVLQPPVGERGALLLRLARDVAHAGERQQAPLAAYLVGRYVELRRAATGAAELEALAEAAEVVAALVGPLDPEKR